MFLQDTRLGSLFWEVAISNLLFHTSVDPNGEFILIPFLKAPLSGMANRIPLNDSHPVEAFCRQHFSGLNETSISELLFTHPATESKTPVEDPYNSDEPPSHQTTQTPQFWVHKGRGLHVDNAYAFQKSLSSLRTDSPIHPVDTVLKSDTLPQIVSATSALLAVYDSALASSSFLLLTADDLTHALTLPTTFTQPFEHRLAKPSWSGFYQSLHDQQPNLPEYLTSPEDRVLDPLSVARLLSLCQRSRTPYILIPDVGEVAISTYIHAMYAACGHLTVKYSEARSKTYSPQRPRVRTNGDHIGESFSRPYTTRFAELLTSAWHLILSRSGASSFHPEHPTSTQSIANAWAQRFAPSSSFAPLQRYKPSRPIASGGAILAHSESVLLNSQTLRLIPAVQKPEAAMLSPAARKKRDPATAAGLWQKLADLSAINQTNTFPVKSARPPNLPAPEPASVLWPNADLWQTIDMVKTLSAFPGFLLNPETLSRGFATTTRAAWDAVQWPGDAIFHELPAAKPWPLVAAWFLGSSPYPTDPKESVKRATYHDTNSSTWSMTLVDSGVSTGSVRLNVRYAVVGSDADLDAKLHLAQVMQGLQNARTVPQDLTEAFNTLGEELRFEARPYFEVDGQAVSEGDWFAATKVGHLYMRLPNGVTIDARIYGERTEQFLLRQKVYAKFANLTYQQLWQVHRLASEASVKNILPEEYVEQLSLKVAPVLQQLDEQLTAPIGEMLRTGPLLHLAPSLRHYQEEGIAWCFLRLKIGLGVCLADEMGLGKTVQAIGLLLAIRASAQPSLVVMPKSVLLNWQRELARFAPELTVQIVEDSAPDKSINIWLMTYPRLRLATSWLKEHEFQMVVLDEAQAIKNSDSQTAEAANQLQSKYRLALSGTPVENHAGELWSLVNWLNPGYLGRVVDFMNYIKLARSSEQKAMLLSPLRACLEPLMLRRTKADAKVQIGLPPKVMQDQECEFSSEQAALYEALLEVILAEEVTGLSAFARRALFLKAISHAKQICVHPDLFYGEEKEVGPDVPPEVIGKAMDAKRFNAMMQKRAKNVQTWSQEHGDGVWLQRSAKMAALAELLTDLKETSRGILIFTQYLGAVPMVQRVLKDSCGWDGAAFVLTGSLSATARQKVVDEFNEACLSKREAAPVLILSLKAGGSGLNLTGADRVVHLDRWWNPAVEDQATDRAHRMGQDKTVFVHTLTCGGTIEEAIGRLFIDKRQLAQDLLGGAEAEHVGSLLSSQETFLDLMDPQRVFSQRLRLTGLAIDKK